MCTLLVTLMCLVFRRYFSHPGRENMIFFNVLSTTFLLFHERRSNFRPFSQPCSYFVYRYDLDTNISTILSTIFASLSFSLTNSTHAVDYSIEWIIPHSVLDKDLSDYFFFIVFLFLLLLRIHFYQSMLHSKSLMENGCQPRYLALYSCV